jgi:hypothetical protein
LSKPVEQKERLIGASRSLERLCNDKNDIVGLLAYGLFKQEQSEWAKSERPSQEDVDKHASTLQESRIGILRGSSERMLLEWVETLREEWYERAHQNIVSHVASEIGEATREKVSSQVSNDLNEILGQPALSQP